ncbi:MAG: hypothetical protein GY869_00905 [Planctomycetes bacterium]|nr:hypothetical protein [Planctomycetota bacterium]
MQIKVLPPLINVSQQQVARLTSLALHPFLIAPLAIVLLLYLDTGNFLSALGWAGLCAAFVIGPALLFLRHKLTREDYTDADVSVQEHRAGFYVFGGASMVVCFGVLLWLGAPTLLITLFATAFLTLGIFAAVTRWWTKVSIHTGIMAGTMIATAFYSLPLAAVLTVATVLVAWSRLVLKRHTLNEVLLGYGLASYVATMVMLIR